MKADLPFLIQIGLDDYYRMAEHCQSRPDCASRDVPPKKRCGFRAWKCAGPVRIVGTGENRSLLAARICGRRQPHELPLPQVGGACESRVQNRQAAVDVPCRGASLASVVPVSGRAEAFQGGLPMPAGGGMGRRSEEHTSELQSLTNLV